MFSWVSEKMVGSGLDGLLLGKNMSTQKTKNILKNLIPPLYQFIKLNHNSFLVLALGLQCGLSTILYGWVPSSEDQAMFYATSFIWGATSASLEFLIMCKLHLNILRLLSIHSW